MGLHPVLILAQQTAPQPAAQVAALLFYAFALFTCLSAWAVVVSQNIIRMSVYLLLTLGGAAGLYFLMEAELLAAIQLIVYAGGTLILIIFGVMLTSRSPFLQLRARPWELGLGVAIGLSIAGILVLAMLTTPQPGASSPALAAQGAPPATRPATIPGPDAAAGPVRAAQPLGGYRQVELVGRNLLTRYVVPFEVVAVLLLVVMIGAAYMARKRAE